MEKQETLLNLKEDLKELKRRVCTCVAIFILAFVVCLWKAEFLVNKMLDMGSGYYNFAYLYPQEVFIQYLGVSFVGALIVIVPVIVLEIGLFLYPALYPSEKKGFIIGSISACILLYAGMTFAIKIMIPFMLRYFAEINAGVSNAEGMVSIEKYISLIKAMCLAFSVTFELPVFSSLFGMIGILKSEWMKKFRKPAIVLIFIVAAFITPPDVTSQFMVAVPTIVLYQISIWIVATIEKKRKGKEESE